LLVEDSFKVFRIFSPTLPNGGVNFECHCVSHLVASPCGYEFREAIKCQKAAGESELEEGACADELIEFMRCAMRTECFRGLFHFASSRI
uniref:CHCH domain-containing protein n=1 Tax=Anisakis simplex TaxID=6269 RepID=A0A0M3J0J6_ANISI